MSVIAMVTRRINGKPFDIAETHGNAELIVGGWSMVGGVIPSPSYYHWREAIGSEEQNVGRSERRSTRTPAAQRRRDPEIVEERANPV